MSNQTYANKLKNPKWQKKRLEILSRDEFTCQHCQDKEETLHVHHMYYEYGKNPWEYDSASLVTLCSGCHEIESEHIKEISPRLLNILKANLFSYELERLAEAIEGAKCSISYPPLFMTIIEILNNENVREVAISTAYKELKKVSEAKHG